MKKKEAKRLNRVFLCLYAVSALIFIAGINRLWKIDVLRSRTLDILRVCDLNVMLIFAPLCIFILALMLYFYKGHKNTFTFLAFIFGAYMLGIGFGMHEPFNAMSVYRLEMTGGISRTVRFMDDELGHWTFFAGFIFISLSLVIAELRKPFSQRIPLFHMTAATLLGLLTGFVIYMNMAWEKTALDLAVIGCCLATALLFKLKYGNPQFNRIPITWTMCLSYGLGLFSTLAHWIIF